MSWTLFLNLWDLREKVFNLSRIWLPNFRKSHVPWSDTCEIGWSWLAEGGFVGGLSLRTYVRCMGSPPSTAFFLTSYTKSLLIPYFTFFSFHHPHSACLLEDHRNKQLWARLSSVMESGSLRPGFHRLCLVYPCCVHCPLLDSPSFVATCLSGWLHGINTACAQVTF